jgi:hypothetical protein
VVVTDSVPTNRPPVAHAGTSYSGAEGALLVLGAATASDPDADPLTLTWTASSPLCSFSSASMLNPSLRCTDDVGLTVTLTVSDGKAAPVSSSVPVTITNANPRITAVTVPASPQPIGTVVVSAPFVDAGASDMHSCSIQWDEEGAAVPASVTQTAGSGTCSGSRQLSAGVYVVTVTVTDDDGGADTETATTLVVIYDPSAGFVTGGGWFFSAPGADALDAGAGGRANFGFVAKYRRGATVPDGETEFQFQAGDLSFRSTSYQWLVVTGGCFAQYKGLGTVNGVPGYEFVLTLRDGQLCGSPGPDGIRMKISSPAGVRYDNTGGTETIGPASGNVQPISGGSIVIHRR